MSELTNNEVMENQVNDETNITADYLVENSGSGRAIGLTVGLITGAIGLGTLAYKKFKSKKKKKKDEQPKKKTKKRLKWVEVEEVDSTDEVPDIVEESEEEVTEE